MDREWHKLEKVFSLQEAVVPENASKYPHRFLFIKQCIELIINTYVDPTKIDSAKTKDSLLVHTDLPPI